MTRPSDLAQRRDRARETYRQGAESARDPRHSAEYVRELLRPLGDAWANEIGRISADIGAARRSLEAEHADMFAKANAPTTAAEAPAVASIYAVAQALEAPEPRGDVVRRAISGGDTLALRALLQAPPVLDMLTPSARQDATDGLLSAVHGERYAALTAKRHELDRVATALERDNTEAYAIQRSTAESRNDRQAIEMASVEALISAAGGR